MSGTLVLAGGRLGSGGAIADVRLRDGVVDGTGVRASGVDDVVRLPPGAVLLPGFVDHHVHATQVALRRSRVDVSAAAGPRDVVDVLRAAARGAGPLVVGHGFRDALWDEPPRRELLDAAFGSRPVAVVSDDLHLLWANGPALALLGAPIGSDGLLREAACTEALDALDHLRPRADLDRDVLAWTDDLARDGVTGLVDFEFADNRTAWTRRAAVRAPSVRVHASVWRPWIDDAEARGLRTGDELTGDGLVVVGPYKVVLDGSLNSRTAACDHAYPGGGHGLLAHDSAELEQLVTRARRAGLEPAVHAIGDRANAIALDVLGRAGGGRIEHAQLLRPGDARRFAGGGVTASVQPQHAPADRDAADRLWGPRAGDAFPYGDLHRAGARLVLGSDAPVSAPVPLAAVAAAVRRSDDDRPPWHPDQSLPLAVALAAASGGRRSVAAGDPADLVVLGADPADVATAELSDVPVLLTVTAGRVTHTAL